MASIDAVYNKQHLKNIRIVEQLIDDVFQRAVIEAGSLSILIDRLNDKIFSFNDYPITKKRVNLLLKDVYNGLNIAIVDGVKYSWTLANNKNNELSRMVFGDNIGKLTNEQYKRYFSNSIEAHKAFIERKNNGLNLSDRVWKYTNEFKNEIELGLDIGIREGKSADEISRDLRQYLQYPDKLFRRVRDEHGNLVLSKNAKAFHPGQGVYRSSYKNARRLGVTETNIAYHTADKDRRDKLDFVVGIQVKLSGNHTLNGEPFHDICDELQGKYPKDFKFSGWHPLCRCHTVSILKTPEELMEDNKKILEGKRITGSSVNEVTDYPENFKQWVKDNEDRIVKAEGKGKLPYFIKNNKKVVDGILHPELNKPTIAELAAQRHAARTPEKAQQLKEYWAKKQQEAAERKRRQQILDNAKARHQARTPKQVQDIKDKWNARNLAIQEEKRRQAILAKAKARHDARSPEQIKDIKKRWEERKKINLSTNTTNATDLQIEKALGIKKGRQMTFEEANALRGNPHYTPEFIPDPNGNYYDPSGNTYSKNPNFVKQYSVNCQSCVVANELRRRGWDVEAFGNVKGSMPEMLSRHSMSSFVDAKGNLVKPIEVKRGVTRSIDKRGRVISKYEDDDAIKKKIHEATKEKGRYFINWKWKIKDGGHIITAERLKDGSLRFYDPQNGKITLLDLSEINTVRGFQILRVDNLQPNMNIIPGVVKKAGSKMATKQLTFDELVYWSNNFGIFGSTVGGNINTKLLEDLATKNIKEAIADYVKLRNKTIENTSRVILDKAILKNNGFKLLSQEKGGGTIFTPDIKTSSALKTQKELPKNIHMARKLAQNGYDVYILSNPNNIKSADYIIAINGKVYYVEAKSSTGKSSLDHNFSKVSEQSERILVDITNLRDTTYITKEIINIFNKNSNLQEILLLKKSRLIIIKKQRATSKDFAISFKKEWEKRK